MLYMQYCSIGMNSVGVGVGGSLVSFEYECETEWERGREEVAW